jgi:hypothetical protein
MLRRTGGLALALAAGVLLGGCGSSGSDTSAQQAPPSPYTPPPCPAATSPAKTNWPADVPADLPKPPHARIQQHTTTSDGVHITKFTTDTSLRTGVLFVVDKLPKAGYVLGRGDAESNEADAPFQHGNTRGLLRMLGLQPCKTLWLLATVDAAAPSGGSPLLPTHSPSGSPSPLPFG